MDHTEELCEVRGELAALRDQVARMTQPTEFLSPKQASEVLNVSLDVLSMWRNERTGPPFIQTSRKFIRYRRADIEKWFDENSVIAN